MFQDIIIVRLYHSLSLVKILHYRGQYHAIFYEIIFLIQIIFLEKYSTRFKVNYCPERY